MADVAAPEPVDRLPVVAHAEEVFMAQQEAGDLLLEVVGVLVLVHEDVLELFPVLGLDFGVIPQQVPGEAEDVVEVQGVLLF